MHAPNRVTDVATRTFRVPGSELDNLAACGEDRTGLLVAGQTSKRMLLLHYVRNRLNELHPGLCAESGFDRNWATLTEARRHNEREVDSVLLYPYVGVWLRALLRRLRQSDRDGHALTDDVGQLGGLAAAAALRAGRVAEVTLRVRRDGAVGLPTLGLIRLRGPARWLNASMAPGSPTIRLVESGTSSDVGTIDLRASRRDPRWWPVRRLRSNVDGQAIEVFLDDVDPYRTLDSLAPTDRIDDREFGRWQARFFAAWEFLVHHHPDRTASLSSEVTTLTPIRGAATMSQLSASSAESYGAVLLTTPRDSRQLAIALIHEHQHIKLGAILGLLRLLAPDETRRYYAPWRDDPRPAHGLLQGTYAYLGLVLFWESERNRLRGAEERRAQFEFAVWRIAVRDAIDDLLAQAGPTDVGARFLRGMRRALGPLLAASVPETPLRLASDWSIERRAAWRLRNVEPDPVLVDDCVQAWLRGSRRPDLEAAAGTLAFGRRSIQDDQYRAVLDPLESAVDAPPGHVAAVRGDFRAAAAHHVERIRAGAAPIEAWAGFALALERMGAPLERPEILRALYKRLADTPDPIAVADWLSGSA